MVEKIAETKKRQYNFSSKHKAKLSAARLLKRTKDDAVKAADFIQCNKIVGVHYDTFGFIEIDHEAANNKFSNGGKELILLEIGETKNI